LNSAGVLGQVSLVLALFNKITPTTCEAWVFSIGGDKLAFEAEIGVRVR
jgi:hypothetical protein